MRSSDLFTEITKYNKPENRFTASFVFLLRYLWKESGHKDFLQIALYDLLYNLSGIDFQNEKNISFEMLKTENGDSDDGKCVPDIQIATEGVLVWIEVKDTAPVNQDLKKYRDILNQKSKQLNQNMRTSLVLLRRNFVSEDKREGIDKDIQWSQLYRMLQPIINVTNAPDSISGFLLKQFVDYLQEKGVIVLDHIDKQYTTTGFPHVMNLFTMVGKEVENFFNNTLGLKIAKFTYENGGAFWHIDKRKNTEFSGYLIEIWCEPGDMEIHMHTKREHVARLENRKIDIEKAQASNFLLEDGWIGQCRSLNQILGRSSAEEQQNELAKLIANMFDEFDTIKSNKPVKRKSRSK